MYIIDFSTDWNQRCIKTQTFDDKSYIIDFIAEKSGVNDFRLKRINKYENGELHPYVVSLNHGRITIEPAPKEESK